MTGRIEAYTHSDSTTANKGGCLIRVETQTDFAARTDEFKRFCKLAAMLCFGCSTESWDISWDKVAAEFPDLEKRRIELEEELGETIEVTGIKILKLSQEPERKMKIMITEGPHGWRAERPPVNGCAPLAGRGETLKEAIGDLVFRDYDVFNIEIEVHRRDDE